MITSPIPIQTLRTRTRRTLDETFAWRERRTIRSWAESYRYVAKEVSSWHGRYSTARTPYQREPMESFTDGEVQTTVLLWASRLGKTETINNAIGYFVDEDPSPMMVMYPTLESAETWSKDMFDPLVEATPCLRRRFGKGRGKRKDRSSTIRHKRFRGGQITAIGANSPSGLRQRQARVLWGDEIDACEGSAGGEGDPITLLFKRAETYHNSVQILSSTPTVKGLSRIENWFERSDKRYWFVPCHACGHHQTLKWSQVRWQDVPSVRETYYLCENDQCESPRWTDAQRVAAVLAGEWRATAPFNGIRGYHLSGLYTTFAPKKGYRTKLHQFAQDFLDAKTSANPEETMRVWTNTFLAETYELTAEKLEHTDIFNRRESYFAHPTVAGALLPEGVLCLTAGVDVQDNRIEVEIGGWGLDQEWWGVEHVTIYGEPRGKKVWQDLDEVLARRYKHPCGAELAIAATCVDSSMWTSQVYRYVRPRQSRRVYAVKGSSEAAMPIVSRPRKSGVQRVTLFMVGTDTAKEQIYSRLQITEPGPGYQHHPLDARAGYDESFFRQLVVEKVVLAWSRGKPVKRFIKKDDERNEALDLRVYGTAAFELLNANLPKLAENLQVSGARRRQQEEAAQPGRTYRITLDGGKNVQAPVRSNADGAPADAPDPEPEPVATEPPAPSHRPARTRRPMRRRGGGFVTGFGGW